MKKNQKLTLRHDVTTILILSMFTVAYESNQSPNNVKFETCTLINLNILNIFLTSEDFLQY